MKRKNKRPLGAGPTVGPTRIQKKPLDSTPRQADSESFSEKPFRLPDPQSETFLAAMLIGSIPQHERTVQALQLKMAGQTTVDPQLLAELESELGLLDMCQQAKDYFANPDASQ